MVTTDWKYTWIYSRYKLIFFYPIVNVVVYVVSTPSSHNTTVDWLKLWMEIAFTSNLLRSQVTIIVNLPQIVGTQFIKRRKLSGGLVSLQAKPRNNGQSSWNVITLYLCYKLLQS